MMLSLRETRSGTFKLAGVIAIFVTGQALGQSVVSFHAELGGNNHVNRYKGGTWLDEPKPLYTSGSEADGQTFPLGAVINWAVKVSAGGTQADGAGAGWPIQGVANVVIDLELRKETAEGPLATDVIWFSNFNDGSGDRPTGYPVNISAAAAFAYSFNLGNVGPGRMIDRFTGTTPRGGPFCGGVGWPLTGDPPKPPINARTYPTAEPGKLIGMGAGYYQWLSSPGSVANKPGIGMTSMPPVTPGAIPLGVVPLFEGQMDTSNLEPGTYVLKATPGAGINVLRGDLNLNNAQNAFATAADQTNGDMITFIIEPCDPVTAPSAPTPADLLTDVPLDVVLSWTPGDNADSRDIYFGTTNPPPFVQNQTATTYTPSGLDPNTTYYWRVAERNLCGPELGPVWSFTTTGLRAIAWRTVRSHGGTNYGITLDPTATGNGSTGPSTDPREGGVLRLEIDFNAEASIVAAPDITGSDGSSPMPYDADPYDGTTISLLFNPGELVSGVCYAIDLDGAVVSTSGLAPIGGNTTCSLRVLTGDTNSNGVVNLGDALYISTRIGQPVADYPHLDLNGDGAITIADVLLAKSSIGSTVVCP